MPRKSVSLHHVSKSPNGGKKGAFWRSLELLNSPMDVKTPTSFTHNNYSKLLYCKLCYTRTSIQSTPLCHYSECGITLKKSLLALSDVPQKTIIGCDCWLMLSAFGPHAIWRDADVMKNLCSRPIFYSPSHHKVLVFMYDIWEARIPNQLGKKNSFIFFFV